MSRFKIMLAIVCFCSAVPDANPSSSPHCLIWDQPRKKRDDYTYTPGIGAHKVHLREAEWNEARRICNEEGGHLAIVNSVAEANIIGGLLRKANRGYAHIGFHDLFDGHDFLTLHSESLAKAGYTQWGNGQPDDAPGEDCGGLDDTGKLHDVYCSEHWVFVCELPIQ